MKYRMSVGIFAGLLALSNVGSATQQMNISSSAFTATYGGNEGFLMRGASIINGATDRNVNVTASMTHAPSSTGFTLYFDGMMNTGGPNYPLMWCSVTSTNYDGTPLYHQNFQVGGTYFWETAVTLTAAQAPYWSYIDVGCDLLANQTAHLYGVTAVGS